MSAFINDIFGRLDFLQSCAGLRNKYDLEPVVPERVLQYFENLLQLRLPEDFRTVITQLGNGINGLFYGLGMRSFQNITADGFSLNSSGWDKPGTAPIPPPVFALGHFDWKSVWRKHPYEYSDWQAIKSRELRSLLNGGTYDLMREQREIKRLYGIDVSEKEYIKPGWIRGALRLCNNLYCNAYLIVDGAPEHVGRVFQTPSHFYLEEGEPSSDYVLQDSFSDFLVNLLEIETNRFTNRRYTSLPSGQTNSRGATRVVFPDQAAAQQASEYFIHEEGDGFWLGTDDNRQLGLGKVRTSTRYALHLPSLDRHGRPLPEALLHRFIKDAAGIGMCWRNWAVGYWTLSHTGALQEELVWIVHSTGEVSEVALRLLARQVLELADQDAVAIEIQGRVEIIR